LAILILQEGRFLVLPFEPGEAWPNLIRGSLSVIACAVYAYALSRFSLSRRGCLEVFGYYLLVQCSDEFFLNYFKELTDIGDGGGNATSVFQNLEAGVIAAFTLCMKAGNFLIWALVCLLAYFAVKFVVGDMDRPLDSQNNGSLMGETSKQALRILSDKFEYYFALDHKSSLVNGVLLFLQLYLTYYLFWFFINEFESGFCATRIVLSCLYHDVSSVRLISVSFCA
jgi:hypothetical protein